MQDNTEIINELREIIKKREKCGDAGIKFVKDNNIGMDSKEMCNRFVSSIETTFENWKPRKKYTLEAV